MSESIIPKEFVAVPSLLYILCKLGGYNKMANIMLAIFGLLIALSVLINEIEKREKEERKRRRVKPIIVVRRVYRNLKPAKCINCGGKIVITGNRGYCPYCGMRYYFEEETKEVRRYV